MRRILLFGKNGQVGWELQRALMPLGELVCLDIDSTNGLCGDLTNLKGLAETVRSVAPDIIVNAAAYTAVDKAEAEPELARCINAQAPALLASEAAALGAWLVHYSTDYVFDGSGSQPWQETDATAPLSIYGITKRVATRPFLKAVQKPWFSVLAGCMPRAAATLFVPCCALLPNATSYRLLMIKSVPRPRRN